MAVACSPECIGRGRPIAALPTGSARQTGSGRSARAALGAKPVVVVIVAESEVNVEGWHDRVNAIIQTFYSGIEGGTAFARLTFGDVAPSGRLPFTVARDAND